MDFLDTQYGFNWGSAKITRCCSDEKKGWVFLQIETPKAQIGIQITKSGKIKIQKEKGKKSSIEVFEMEE